jgi:ubiquinone/menaquinone biosynthesis C-methylase UbiE
MTQGRAGTVTAMFDLVADYYNRSRPDYAPGIFDALEDVPGGLHRVLVADVGAGTGIASRQLLERGAKVIALDVAQEMLRQARESTPSPACILSDGNVLPLRSHSVQFVCFAQAWHWFDPLRAASEVFRVLAPGGRWAAWWSHAHADGEVWFDAYQDLMEKTCAVYLRRNPDAGSHSWSVEPIAATGLFGEGHKVIVPWIRHVSCEQWLVEERSEQCVEALDSASRAGLLDGVGAIINNQFPHHEMEVPYRTHMWIAQPA